MKNQFHFFQLAVGMCTFFSSAKNSRSSVTFRFFFLPLLFLLFFTPPSFAQSTQTLIVVNADLHKMPIPIQLQLIAHAKRYVQNIANNIIPHERKKSVSRNGKEYVARYLMVDPATTEMEALPYIEGKKRKAILSYHETEFQCCGESQQAALNGPFVPVRTRRMIEILQYKQDRWN